MPRLTKEQKLEQKKKVAAQAMAELRSAAAAVGAQKRERNRKRDTRRKILLGAWVISSAENNLSVSKSIERFIAGLEEERDKEVFADWPIPAPANTAAPQAPAVSAKPAAPGPGSVVLPTPRPSAPAQQAGAFGGAPVSPPSSTAPAPTGAASAQPVKVTTT